MAIVLLTGASSGLGAALAPLLAADGDRVVLTARRRAPLEAIVAQITAAGGQAMALPLDVSDREAVFDTVRQIEAAWGPVEVLVANAGIGESTPAAGFDSRVLARILDVNVNGVAHCVDAVLPGMLAAGRGQIVGIGSLAGYRGLPGSAAYCASKGALRLLLEAFRAELRPRGIKVTYVAPGFVETPMTARNAFQMPFLMPVEKGAAHLRRAIRKAPPSYKFPWQMGVLIGLARALPPFIFDRVLRDRTAFKESDPRNAVGVDD